MADPLLPGPANVTVDDGPSPSSAGMSYSASAAAWDQAAKAFGSAENLVQAHQDTVDAAQRAKINSTIQTQQQALSEAHQYDPGGLQKSMAEARSGFVASVGGRYALHAGEAWDLQSQATFRGAQAETFARDHTLAIQGLNDRSEQVTSNLVNEAGSGAPLAILSRSPTFAAGLQEQASIGQALVRAKAIPPEDLPILQAKQTGAVRAAAWQSHLLSTLHDQGAEAAYKEEERFRLGAVAGQPTDESAWEHGVDLQPHERALMVAKGHAALTGAVRDQREALQLTQAASDAKEEDLKRRINNSVATMEMTGKPDPNVTDAEILASKGSTATQLDYMHRLAAAQAKHQQQGDLAGYPSAAAAAEHLASTIDLSQLPGAVKDDKDVDANFEAIQLVERGVAPDGTPRVSPKGALGASQLLLGTARMVAQQHGLPEAGLSDADLRARLMDRDQTFNRSVGRAYYNDLLAKLGGDSTLAAIAYHGGLGQVVGSNVGGVHRPGILERFGDPRRGDLSYGELRGKMIAAGMPESGNYISLFADAQGGGKAAAEYHALQAADGPWGKARTAYTDDPIKFAAEHGKAPVQPLPDVGAAGFGQALAQRQAQATVMASNDQVPFRYTSNDERTLLKSRLAGDPSQGTKLAMTATNALGAAGAQALFRELGVNEPAANLGIIAGSLQAQGRPLVANAINSGIAARAAGAKDGALPHGVTWQKVQDSVAPAFRYAPGMLAGVMQAAQMAHLSDAQRGAADVPDAYVRSVAGGTHDHQGVTYGGVAPVNGQPTLHPTWMRNGAFPDALRTLGDQGTGGPVFANGQAMRGADMARMQPFVQPDGRYALLDPRSGKLAAGRDGKPFMLDMDAMKPWLISRVPRVAGVGL